MCIRGFHHLGYEVGFARVGSHLTFTLMNTTNFLQESFNSRLKAQGDDGSTNLYISNLPKDMTEVVSLPPVGFMPAFSHFHHEVQVLTLVIRQELGIIFREKQIVSSKILRDSMGNSRGVGFAR